MWETLWIEHDAGIPPSISSDLPIEGRDAAADRRIVAAIEALAATEPRFDFVDWDGREVLRL